MKINNFNQSSHEKSYSRTFNPLRDKDPSTFNYDPSLEAEYISNISDAYQRAEEETKRAELMLAQWKRDESMNRTRDGQSKANISRQSKQIIQDQSHSYRRQTQSEQSESEDDMQSYKQDISHISKQQNQQKQLDTHVERRIHSLRRELGIKDQPSFQHVRSSDRETPAFQNQLITHQISHSNKTLEAERSFVHRHLNPQILDNMSNFNTNDSHLNSKDKSFQKMSKSNIIQLQNVPITISHVTDDNSYSTVNSQPNNNINNYQSTDSETSVSQLHHPLYLNENINTMNHHYPRETEQTQIIEQPKIPLVNISHEGEMIALDKHYRQVLRSEREEHQRQIKRIQQQAVKEAERKYKAEINELQHKTDKIEKLELENSKIKVQYDKVLKDNESMKKKKKKYQQQIARHKNDVSFLQKKLDDLWERQQLEKENAKLTTKYEVEADNRRTISDMTNKIIQLEAKLTSRDKELHSTLKQLDTIKRELQNESVSNIALNKSRDATHETQSIVLEEQNRKLNEHVAGLELQIGKVQLQETEISEKYESLKRRFASLVKEKELLEQNKFQETAKFKNPMKEECCLKWRNKAQELSEKYFVILKNMKMDLNQLRQLCVSKINEGSREVHTEIIQSLKEYLDQTPKQASDVLRSRKNSTVVMSKTQGQIQLPPAQHMQRDSDISKSYILSTDRGAGGKSDRSYLKTMDNSTLLPPRREQSASLRMKMPQMHKTIDGANKKQKKKGSKSKRKRSQSAEGGQNKQKEKRSKRSQEKSASMSNLASLRIRAQKF